MRWSASIAAGHSGAMGNAHRKYCCRACYLATNNLQEVAQEQRAILALYRQDIAKYDPSSKLFLEDIFALIPSELNSKNKLCSSFPMSACWLPCTWME